MSLALLITIDGPVSAGKSTVGRGVAEKLGYHFIDTGVMYRALTWKAIKLGVDLDDEQALTRISAKTKIALSAAIDKHDHVVVDGQELSHELRSQEVERAVSLVSRVAGVRKVLVAKQRELAHNGKLVMAGRDIGTVVLPHAELKVFLLASAEERARRRYRELLEKGEEVDYDVILDDLKKRDELDSQRAVSPLRPASDARLLDTESLSLEQVVDKVCAWAKGG